MQGPRGSGAPPTIADVKMDVFLPIHEQPWTSVVLARMAQSFAEMIGLPAMQRLHNANSSMNRNTQTVLANAALRVDTQPLIPSSATSWHTFYGCDSNVLEQLIAEKIEVFHAMPEISPTVAQPLPPSAPGPSTPVAQSSLVLQGKHPERKPWNVDDIKRYVEQFRACDEHDEVGRRAITQRVSARMPDLFNIVLDLDRRIHDLEAIQKAQVVEIESLRHAPQSSVNRSSDLLRPPFQASLTVSFVCYLSRIHGTHAKQGEVDRPRTVLWQGEEADVRLRTVGAVDNRGPLRFFGHQSYIAFCGKY